MGKKRIITKSGEDISKIEEKMAGVSKKGAKINQIERDRIYINVSYNNTIISVSDLKGNIIATSSAGALGFKGPKKATPFAASKVVAALAEKMKKIGLKKVEVYIKGIGGGRKSAIHSLANQGLDIDLIKDVTPLPHNGPKPPKPRRI